MHADPFQLDPCHKVTYYYDQNGKMVGKSGIMEKAVYKISRMQQMNAKHLYGCVGAITLRLSPNQTQTL
jgi:hypothetical protein